MDGKKCSFKAYINQETLDTEVRYLLQEMWAGGYFDSAMQHGMNMHGDEKKLKERLTELQKNRHRAVLEKDKYLADIEKLDILDPMYEMRYSDCEKLLNNAYNRIAGIDEDIKEVNADLNTQIEAKATKREAHQALQGIAEGWDKWSSKQKKIWFKHGLRNSACFHHNKKMEHGSVAYNSRCQLLLQEKSPLREKPSYSRQTKSQIITNNKKQLTRR